MRAGQVLILVGVLMLAGCADVGHYRVKPGDTLYSIAWRYGQQFQDVAAWNNIQPPYLIHEGEWIRVVPPDGSRPDYASVAEAPPSPQMVPPSGSEVPGPTVSGAVSRADPPPAVEIRPRGPAATTPAPSESVPPGPLVWSWPAQGRVVRGFAGQLTDRQGVDISGTRGDPVRAAARGRVVYAGSGLIGYGQLIIIKHDELFLSAYAHNRKLLVKEGDSVRSGQLIAELGSSGTDRPKLHFQIRHKGKPVDPVRYLPRR